MEVTQALLRVGHKFRPGQAIVPTSVTVHNTGNPRSTAANERAWLDNRVNLDSGNFVSWHYVVDETSIIQAIPDLEMAYHAGDREGNATSIGVEVCEVGNQHVVWRRAVLLVVSLLRRHGLGADHVRSHRDWTGKNCPRLILPEWPRFLRDVRLEMGEEPMFTGVRIALSDEARDFPGLVSAGRVFVPVRLLLEQLGYAVSWEESTATVAIAREVMVPQAVPERWTHRG